jgi:hypothetical protein
MVHLAPIIVAVYLLSGASAQRASVPAMVGPAGSA